MLRMRRNFFFRNFHPPNADKADSTQRTLIKRPASTRRVITLCHDSPLSRTHQPNTPDLIKRTAHNDHTSPVTPLPNPESPFSLGPDTPLPTPRLPPSARHTSPAGNQPIH